ncbi:C-type lectin domain-containing protein [Archangium lipolyticum]|uniref:C-type lectin domain-containing protein n=1 Tax=Archangium lipolyticum TaxID=2970465 RepID=UPI00214A7B0D|nr:C-type lectin domain-containing protein [Archangium lipolyticum]
MKRNLSGMFSKLGMLVLVAVPVIGCGVEPVEAESEARRAAMEDVGVTESAISYGGHDYLFVSTPKTWDEAQTYCQLAGGYSLVTINDASEESFLQTQEAARGSYNWWIGFNDKGIEGAWVWANGSSSYTNWDPGQPDNWQNAEDCAADRLGDPAYNYYSDTWNDWSCNHAFSFICERNPVPTVNRGSFSYSASNTDNAKVNTFNHSLHLFAGQVFTAGTCGVPGSSGSGDTYLRLNNPTGKEIASNDNAGGPCGLLSNISIVVPVSGTYTLQAGCYGYTSCGGTVAFNY